MSWESPVHNWMEINGIVKWGRGPSVAVNPRGEASRRRWWIACHEFDGYSGETACETAQSSAGGVQSRRLCSEKREKFTSNKFGLHLIPDAGKFMLSLLIFSAAACFSFFLEEADVRMVKTLFDVTEAEYTEETHSWPCDPNTADFFL